MLMVSSKISSSDISVYMPYFDLKNIGLIYKNQFFGEKLKILGFFGSFFKLLPKFKDFLNSDHYVGKNHIKVYQTISRF